MKQQILPEDYYDGLQARLANVDTYAFTVCEYLHDCWAEFGAGIISAKKAENNWSDKEAPGRAHRWFISTSAAKVGASESTLYIYKRVGDNIIPRGFRKDNDNLTMDHWTALMINAEKDDMDLISEDVIRERLDWVNEQTDKFAGQPPSATDIKKEYRKNGFHTETMLGWNRFVRSAKSFLDSYSLGDGYIGMRTLAQEVIDLDESIKGEHDTGIKDKEAKEQLD